MVESFGAILTILVAVLAEKFEGRTKKILWGLFVLTVLVLAVLQIRERHKSEGDHRQEVEHLNRHIDDLQGAFNVSEFRNASDMGYLKAKLEESEKWNETLSRFTPAIYKLAQTSAEFSRKQYESKITSDKDLKDLTMGVVKNIREFSQKYSRMDRQLFDELSSRMTDMRLSQLTEAERRQQLDQQQQKYTQLSDAKRAEFRNSILPDALYFRQELVKRKIPEPALPPMEEATAKMVLGGTLAGPDPELALADYLELMAKPLGSK